MKRFAVFVVADYYPAGGWNDLVGVYGTLGDAIEAAKEDHNDNWHIVDLRSLKIVEKGPRKDD